MWVYKYFFKAFFFENFIYFRELTLTDEMIQRSREERRYKYSLVSLLVCGLILITTINLGLGSRNCSHVDGIYSSNLYIFLLENE